MQPLKQVIRSSVTGERRHTSRHSTSNQAVAKIADRTAYDAVVNDHLDNNNTVFIATETKLSRDQESNNI